PLVQKLDETVTRESLCENYMQFVHKWKVLKPSGPVDASTQEAEEASENEDNNDSDNSDNDDGGEEVEDSKAICNGMCQNCAVCVYRFLSKYRLYSEAYRLLYFASVVALTLSCSQVPCERAFSKMKFIKNRLRSRLSGENLEVLTLMSCERSILNSITN